MPQCRLSQRDERRGGAKGVSGAGQMPGRAGPTAYVSMATQVRVLTVLAR